ncbi:winged helix-turn-helix domain-containing protein [Chloroflexota bacterium]
MPEWMFLTNHALVLSFISKQPHITARELSTVIGITERAVRRIIADLDDVGYINKTKEGRRIRYRINTDLPLRHETQWEIDIGEFLKALGWKRGGKRRHIAKVNSETPQAEA